MEQFTDSLLKPGREIAIKKACQLMTGFSEVLYS
jgi:hypothetical protein